MRYDALILRKDIFLLFFISLSPTANEMKKNERKKNQSNSRVSTFSQYANSIGAFKQTNVHSDCNQCLRIVINSIKFNIERNEKNKTKSKSNSQ